MQNGIEYFCCIHQGSWDIMIFVPSFQTGSRFDNRRTKNCPMFCSASSKNPTSQKALSYFTLFIKYSLRMALNIFVIALTVPKLSRFNCENPLSGSRFESGKGATNLELEPSSWSYAPFATWYLVNSYNLFIYIYVRVNQLWFCGTSLDVGWILKLQRVLILCMSIVCQRVLYLCLSIALKSLEYLTNLTESVNGIQPS